MFPLDLIDGYKLDHRRQYPPGTTKVYSNWTPRSSRVQGQDEVVFFGLQYFLERYLHFHYLAGEFGFEPIEYGQMVDKYLGPNDIGIKHMQDLKKLGYFPLEFRALPEGTLCPLRVPCLTVENTHPDFFWLVNYFETLLSNVLWMPCTSATTAYRMRRLLDLHCLATGGDTSFVPWQGHDFSMRGLPGIEAAMLSGAGHLLSFTGTDTIPAVGFVNEYYPGDNGLVGGSVAATEHSVMSAGGEKGELATFERILSLYPQGIVSIVSDTWDLWHVIGAILPRLKDKIMARDGKVVIRPDSGNPADVLCGHGKQPGVVPLLWTIFGGTKNSKGYKQLDPHIGVIYGDSINYERADEICSRLAAQGFASTNVVFGIGSYTYQFVTRDTYGFAMKATWCEIDGKGHDIFKKPVTDDGIKFSATGRLSVVRGQDGRLTVIERATPEEEARSLLIPVWKDGHFRRKDSFATIRERTRS